VRDADIVRIARRLRRAQQEIEDGIRAIEDSDHPNAAALAEDLWRDCWFADWPTFKVLRHLEHPERWAVDEDGIRRAKR
jgi:hypothetical protein